MILDDDFESQMVFKMENMVEKNDFHINPSDDDSQHIWKRNMFETTNQQNVFRPGKDL